MFTLPCRYSQKLVCHVITHTMLQHDCELSEDVKITQPLVRIKQDPEAGAAIKQEHDKQVTLLPHLQNMFINSVFDIQ